MECESARKAAAAALGAALVALLAWPAAGDLGPKPVMEFQLRDRTGARPAIVGGRHLLCADPACVKSEPLVDYGPQRFSCAWPQCYSMSYGFSTEHHRLVVEFADKTRTSNVFHNADFTSIYAVQVRPDDLFVEKLSGRAPEPPPEAMDRTPPPPLLWPMLFAVSLSLTLLLELGAAWACFRKSPRRRRLLLCVLAANLVSLPMVWLAGHSSEPGRYWTTFAWTEAAAVIFEGVFLAWLNKEVLSLRKALLLSLAMNALSAAVGDVAIVALFAERGLQALAWLSIIP